jgi:pimeloyl-ACP methyl ester carboxylesterase
MEKVLYVIPGWKDSCKDKRYQQLAAAAKKKGYNVVCHDIDWSRSLSPQVFAVPENAVVFGFSLGAILAWLVAQRYPCQHIILASMTPHYSFTDPEIKKALIDLVGAQVVADVIRDLRPGHQAQSQTILYGDQEEEQADILVPNTGHELNSTYIEEVMKIL